MAVVVQCYNCSNILELDEGFRGGVCRCSQCGSLLQVPKGTSTDARRARPATPDAPPSGVQRPSSPTDDPGLSRGQFDPRSPSRPASPGDSVAGLRPVGVAKAVAPPPARPASAANAVVIKKNRTLFYMAIIIMVLIGIGLVGGLVWFFILTAHKPDETPAGAEPAPAIQRIQRVETPNGPTLLANIPLVGSKIVFCLDGGSANQESFDFVRKGIEDAVGMLGADQQFTVAVWKDEGIKTIPEKGWASKATFANYKEQLDNLAAFGSSDPVAGMVKSLQLDGDQVIFITAKYGLTSDMAPPVLAVRKTGQRIDAIKIGNSDADSPLEKIVTAAGGKFIERMDVSQLESIVNH